MSLFPLPDVKKTKERADAVLRQYRRLNMIAGVNYVQKVTATYSFEPRSYTGVVSNAMAKQIEKKADAEQELKYIEEGLNAIPDVNIRKILFMKYCSKEEDMDKAIYVDLGYASSEFYRKVEKGLMYFASAYRNGILEVY